MTLPDPLAPPPERREVGGLDSPYRQVGGAPLMPEQLEVWRAEGLPASCLLCERYQVKFVWMEWRIWVCPGYDANCMSFIRLEDLLTSYDGGMVWCTVHEGCPPHIMDAQSLPGCRRDVDRHPRLRRVAQAHPGRPRV